MTKKWTAVGIGLGFIALFCLGGDDDTKQTSRRAENLGQLLRDITEGDEQAGSQLQILYGDIETKLVRDLRNTSKKDIAYHSRLHLLAMIAGEWRFTNAVGELSEGIKLRLAQKDFPEFQAPRPGRAYYPLASALAKIGDRNVMRHMLRLVRDEKSGQRERELAVWVLFDAFGGEAARAILENATERADEKQIRQHLSEATELIKEGDQLLLDD